MNNYYTFGSITTLGNVFKVEKCQMTPEHFECYEKWAKKVSKKFNETKKGELDIFELIIAKNVHIMKAKNYKDVPYGTSNLFEAGSAIFCIKHVCKLLQIQQIGVKKLAEQISQKGYFSPENGTCPYLLDRLGATRVEDVNILFLELRNARPVTALIQNHYVNITGVIRRKFVVEDPEKSEIQNYPIREYLDKIQIAWVW